MGLIFWFAVKSAILGGRVKHAMYSIIGGVVLVKRRIGRINSVKTVCTIRVASYRPARGIKFGSCESAMYLVWFRFATRAIRIAVRVVCVERRWLLNVHCTCGTTSVAIQLAVTVCGQCRVLVLVGLACCCVTAFRSACVFVELL